jgi:hypothetical protein
MIDCCLTLSEEYFSYNHDQNKLCVVCSSSITDSDYPFGIFKLFLPIINLVGKTLPLRNESLDCHGYEDTVDIIRNICSAMGQEGRKIITKLIYLQCESSFVK